jgi:hypothetical protein
MNQEFQIQESPACVKFSRIMRELHASVKKLFTKAVHPRLAMDQRKDAARQLRRE